MEFNCDHDILCFVLFEHTGRINISSLYYRKDLTKKKEKNQIFKNAYTINNFTFVEKKISLDIPILQINYEIVLFISIGNPNPQQ